jgi:hypothetical protein
MIQNQPLCLLLFTAYIGGTQQMKILVFGLFFITIQIIVYRAFSLLSKHDVNINFIQKSDLIPTPFKSLFYQTNNWFTIYCQKSVGVVSL